ncbi:MAG: antibiotic biosynthesis monooxygenase [Alphaproteobacteria bacterium]|nr:antibiotic biosynthesis monooxygenase [Alphaproteobacteria bacterium]MBM3652852.1 antibiotic biosynthesis monooxygenase [Alphaproteobacteria bacterium]
MFMASNQFRVVKGCEETFETAWRETSVRLKEATGLIGFRFHKGREIGLHVLYFSVTMWETEERFIDWRRAELYGTPSIGPRCASRLDEFDAAVSRSNPQ